MTPPASRRIRIAARALGLALAAAAAAGLPPDDTASPWREFSPPDAGFSIRLPGTPTEPEDAPAGMRQYEVKNGDEDYVVSYADLPEEMRGEEPDKVLERLRDDFVDSIPGAKMTGSTPFKLDGHAGLTWNVEATSAKDDKFRMKMSAVVAGNRLYHYGYIGPARSFREPAVDRFLETFRLLSP